MGFLSFLFKRRADRTKLRIHQRLKELSEEYPDVPHEIWEKTLALADRTTKGEVVVAAVKFLVRAVYNCPAGEVHHQQHFGVLRHSLDVALKAVDMVESEPVLNEDGTINRVETNLLHMKKTTAVILAALFHDSGKFLHLRKVNGYPYNPFGSFLRDFSKGQPLPLEFETLRGGLHYYYSFVVLGMFLRTYTVGKVLPPDVWRMVVEEMVGGKGSIVSACDAESASVGLKGAHQEEETVSDISNESETESEVVESNENNGDALKQKERLIKCLENAVNEYLLAGPECYLSGEYIVLPVSSAVAKKFYDCVAQNFALRPNDARQVAFRLLVKYGLAKHKDNNPSFKCNLKGNTRMCLLLYANKLPKIAEVVQPAELQVLE